MIYYRWLRTIPSYRVLALLAVQFILGCSPRQDAGYSMVVGPATNGYMQVTLRITYRPSDTSVNSAGASDSSNRIVIVLDDALVCRVKRDKTIELTASNVTSQLHSERLGKTSAFSGTESDKTVFAVASNVMCVLTDILVVGKDGDSRLPQTSPALSSLRTYWASPKPLKIHGTYEQNFEFEGTVDSLNRQIN